MSKKLHCDICAATMENNDDHCIVQLQYWRSGKHGPSGSYDLCSTCASLPVSTGKIKRIVNRLAWWRKAPK